MSLFSKKPAGDTPAEQPSGQNRQPASASAAKARHFRRGAFSAGVTALAVAVVVIFNLLAAQLPDSVTQFDMTSSGIYDISQTSVDYLSAVTEDVEIHVLENKDSVDSRIVRFLHKYEELSDHLSVEYTDPVVHPSVLSKYGAESNTVVVTCPATGRQESFALDDVIGYDPMSYYYYGTKTETDFDAEGLLTSAVDSVLSGATRKVYQTSGHEESSLPSDVEELLGKSHLSVESVNLMTNNGVPEDCDLLLILAPARDLADDELTMLRDYLASGGQVVYCMNSQLTSLPNFEALCASYGMSVADGVIADTQRYYQNIPFLFFPVTDTSVDAAGTLSADATVLFYNTRGMTLTTPERDSITVQSFLNTSEGGCAVTEDGSQTTGVYSVGAVATEEIDDNLTARLTVYGSMSLIDPTITGTATNLDNNRLFAQSVICGFSDISSINIEPVSLQEPTNTVSTGGLWALLFILVIPLAVIILGFVRWMRRRRL